MNTHDSYALASDWAKVCEAADVDTDATAEEVIEGLRKRTKLSGYWRCAMTADIRTAAQREKPVYRWNVARAGWPIEPA